MSYEIMKVFDINNPKPSREIWETSNILNGGYNNYYPFTIVEHPTGENEGGGYCSDEQVVMLTNWLIEKGARVGETVLIKHWW